jgi:hypothetical protein
MNNWFLSVFLLILTTAYSNDLQERGWSVLKKDSSSEFVVKQGNEIQGKVVRTGRCTPRYYYDLYDTRGQLQMRGITRAFCMGIFAAWGMEIDLYADDRLAGTILGQCCTKARAKFVFCNANGEEVAHAYLKEDSTDFLFLSVRNEGEVIGELNGKVYGDLSKWEMKFSNSPQAVDERALLVFAGFVADYEKSFVPPPPAPVYYPVPTPSFYFPVDQPQIIYIPSY